MWSFKRIRVPESNNIKEVDAVQLWEVRWQSRNGEFHGETSREVEAFPTEKEASEFAESLKNAFKLIRHTSGNRVQIIKAR